MRPRIGILTGLGNWEQRERFFVKCSYVQAIWAAGGLPLLIPPTDDVAAYLEIIDGLLLPGGVDLDPSLYGEEPRLGIERIEPRWDRGEQALLAAALEAKLPLFGICRGMQALVVAMGGKLYQDLAQTGTELAHRQSAPPQDPWHQIRIGEGSLLSSLLGDECRVNSFHHQGAKKVVGLTPIAWSPDNLVEAVVGEGFVLGVQWHPELMIGQHPEQFKLFQGFVEAARNAL